MFKNLMKTENRPLSFAISIGIGAVIVASGAAPVVMLGCAVVSGMVISYAEDKARQWLIE